MKMVLKRGACENVDFFKYPDGQQSCRLMMVNFERPENVSIECSIRNFSELEQLLCLVAALRKEDFYVEGINFKFLFGLRSDRAFNDGMPNYFRDVLAPIINNLKVETIDIFHPHSMLAANCLRAEDVNFGYPNIHLILPEVNSWYILGGDKTVGASTLRRRVHMHGWFEKTRKLGEVKIHLPEETLEFLRQENKPILIIDDLCDGGATFIREAEYLKEHLPDYPLNLYVSHGIFSQGVEHVAQHFNAIYTTDSWQDFEEHPKLFVTKVFE